MSFDGGQGACVRYSRKNFQFESGIVPPFAHFLESLCNPSSIIPRWYIASIKRSNNDSTEKGFTSHGVVCLNTSETILNDAQ